MNPAAIFHRNTKVHFPEKKLLNNLILKHISNQFIFFIQNFWTYGFKIISKSILKFPAIFFTLKHAGRGLKWPNFETLIAIISKGCYLAFLSFLTWQPCSKLAKLSCVVLRKNGSPDLRSCACVCMRRNRCKACWHCLLRKALERWLCDNLVSPKIKTSTKWADF